MTSNKQYKLGLHLFRRDFRLADNLGLIEACKLCEIVVPVFMFTYEQIRDNPLKSNNCVQFLCESLHDLNTQLTVEHSRLFIFYGDGLEIIRKLVKQNAIELISFNMEYTKYGRNRDDAIKSLCDAESIKCVETEDITLNPMGSVRTSGGQIYTKYTPYFRASSSRDIPKPTDKTPTNYLGAKHKLKGVAEYSGKLEAFHDNITNLHLIKKGGRAEALKILADLKPFNEYNDRRNELTYQTTHLSAYNKFGCVSIREVYWAIRNKLGKSSQLLAQLFWRDFFYTLSFYHPEIYSGSMNPKWRNIKWSGDSSKFKAWCRGETGFPIVDAAMREINATGFMHNRARLIVSNFLSRMLGVDWRQGEHYFAKMLYDYDPAQNNLGWQITASVSGTESRVIDQTIMNPWIQSHKFDRDATYIKKWLPELEAVPANQIHKWNEVCDDYIKKGIKYICPILDYKTSKEANLALYRKYISK
jgi:deoxyribodipyrimidine photo-lyase